MSAEVDKPLENRGFFIACFTVLVSIFCRDGVGRAGNMRGLLRAFHRCMQYSENKQLLTLYSIDDDVREVGNNKFPCSTFASAFPYGRLHECI